MRSIRINKESNLAEIELNYWNEDAKLLTLRNILGSKSSGSSVASTGFRCNNWQISCFIRISGVHRIPCGRSHSAKVIICPLDRATRSKSSEKSVIHDWRPLLWDGTQRMELKDSSLHFTMQGRNLLWLQWSLGSVKKRCFCQSWSSFSIVPTCESQMSMSDEMR
jgi:hypothetical protein